MAVMNVITQKKSNQSKSVSKTKNLSVLGLMFIKVIFNYFVPLQTSLVLLEYLCGVGDNCNRHKDINKMVETVKHNILNNYFIVGLLEEIELTLKLMETKMPEFLSGVLDVYRGPIGRQSTYTSATAFNYTITEEVREYLSNGPLKYSVDVYSFISSLFWDKIRANNIK